MWCRQMPNLVDTELSREKWRHRFRAYWSKESAYKKRKLEANRHYVNSSFARMHAIYVRKRDCLGLIPLFDVLKITGLSRIFLQTLRRAGVLPEAIRFRSWHCYTVEQVGCLTLAALYATIDAGYYSHISHERFAEYVKQHWPWEVPYEGDKGDSPEVCNG